MAQWYEQILKGTEPVRAPNKQDALAMARGATLGTSDVTAPLGASISAFAQSPEYRKEFMQSPKQAVQQSFKLYNDQKKEYERNNFNRNLLMQVLGGAPIAVGQGLNLLKQVALGGLTGATSEASNVASNVAAGNKDFGGEDVNKVLQSGLMGAGATALLGGVGRLGGEAVGRTVSALTGSGATSPFSKKVNISDVVTGEPKEVNVKPLIDTIESFNKKKLENVYNVVKKNEGIADFGALKDKTIKNLEKDFTRSITQKHRPAYSRLFYTFDASGNPANLKLADETKVKNLFNDKRIKSFVQNAKDNLELNKYLTTPDDKLIPENSLEYLNALSSYAKKIVRNIPDKDKSSRDYKETYNAASKIIRETDKLINERLSPQLRELRKNTQQSYVKAIEETDAAINNIKSGLTSTPNTRKILDKYIGKELNVDYNPELDFLDLVKRTPAPLSPLSREDNFRVGQIGADIASSSPGALMRDITKLGAERINILGRKNNIIDDYGNFLTQDEGIKFLEGVVKSKTLADRQKFIKNFVNYPATVIPSAVGQQLPSMQPDKTNSELKKKNDEMDKLFENPPPFELQNEENNTTMQKPKLTPQTDEEFLRALGL